MPVSHVTPPDLLAFRMAPSLQFAIVEAVYELASIKLELATRMEV